MLSLLSFLGILVSLCLALVHCQAGNGTNTTIITLPPPPGSFAPKLTIDVITDESRPDPYNQTTGPRQLVINRFDPIPKDQCSEICTAAYMPSATAAYYDKLLLPDPSMVLYGRLQLSGLCCSSTTSPNMTVKDQQKRNDDSYPLLLLSPGFTASRLEYNVMASYLSSYGYTVVTIDHTYDADFVEFPDGTVAPGVYAENFTLTGDVPYSLSVRVQDVQFVAEQLSEPLAKVGLLGHSLGGDTAAEVMLADTIGKFPGGINLDGMFFGPAAYEGLGTGLKSFMIWENPTHNDNNDASWDAWWNTTDKVTPSNPRWELRLADSQHRTFMDDPLLVDVSRTRSLNSSYFDSMLGTINGVRAMDVLVTYMKSFFDYSMKQENETLLGGPSEKYPEVEFVKVESY